MRTPMSRRHFVAGQRRHQVVLAFGLLSLLPVNCGDAWAAAHAVWSEAAEQGIAVRYAGQNEQGWSSPLTLAGDGGVHITPALASDPQGNVWVAWVDRGTAGYSLRYTVLSNGAVSASGSIPTVAARSYAPTMLVDGEGTPWAAWSSFDGQDEDIYASHWDGNAWSSPVRVHADNDLPDTLPVLGLSDTGQVWISWTRLQNAESLTLSSFWSAGSWSVPQEEAPATTAPEHVAQTPVAAVHAALANTASLAADLPAMPAQAASRIMGAMTVTNSGQVQSLSDRIAPLRTGE